MGVSLGVPSHSQLIHAINKILITAARITACSEIRFGDMTIYETT